MNECFYACNKNILCRIFDYGSNIPGQCRLFEGDTNQLGSIIPSSLSNSFVGVIKITPSLYTQYGKSCSSICKESRYLICNNQSICECPPHSYWNSSQGICLAQTPKLGAPCEQNMNMCREDLNYTCLQFNSCGREYKKLSYSTIDECLFFKHYQCYLARQLLIVIVQ
jgi:hypothetical protein